MTTLNQWVAGAAFLTCSTLAAAGESWLSQYHLIVSGELKNVSEVEGRAFVNHVNVRNSFNVGVNYSSPSDQINLAIGGTLKQGGAIQLNSGSAYFGGKAVQKGNQWGLETDSTSARTLNMNTKGGTVLGAPATPAFDSVYQGIAAESEYYNSLKANSSLTYSGNAAKFVIGADVRDGEVAVFSLSDADMNNLFVNGKMAQIEFSLNGVDPSAVLINVTGKSYTWGNAANFVGLWTENKPDVADSFRSNVLWNFVNATDLTMNRGFYGTLLAPQATLKNTGGAMEGAVAVRNLDISVEIHAPLFNGNFPQVGAVPEASTGGAAVALLGLAGGVLWRRRRTAR